MIKNDISYGCPRRICLRFYCRLRILGLPHMISWCVYLLQCSDNTLYCGMTNNLEKRLAMHNKGTGGKYTRARTPVSLVWSWGVLDKSAALKLEHRIKKLSRPEKLELIERKNELTFKE